MTSEGLGEMFEGDSADMCARKFPLVSMGGQVNTSSVRRRGARTPIGASGNLNSSLIKFGLPPGCSIDVGALMDGVCTLGLTFLCLIPS